MQSTPPRLADGTSSPLVRRYQGWQFRAKTSLRLKQGAQTGRPPGFLGGGALSWSQSSPQSQASNSSFFGESTPASSGSSPIERGDARIQRARIPRAAP